MGNGGTGATTLASNSILTGNGTSAIQAEAGLSYSAEHLKIGDNDHGEAIISRLAPADPGSGAEGGDLSIKAGDGIGTNKVGGDLNLYGGTSTGAAGGGKIAFFASPGGGASGSTASTQAEVGSINSAGNLQIDGGITTGSTSFVNSSGVVQVATQGTIDHDSLANFVAAEHYDWASDNSGTATIHANNITDLHGAGVDGSANQLLTDDGDGTVTSEAGLTYDSETLTIGDDDNGIASIKRLAHSDEAGGNLAIYGGNGGGTNKSGGSLGLYAGASTGATYGGDILFYSNGRGSSGDSVNTSVVYMSMLGEEQTLLLNNVDRLQGPTDGDFTIQSDGNLTFKIDLDNDESTQLFQWMNASVVIAKLHEGGTLDLQQGLTVGGFTGGSGISAINSSGEVVVAAQPNITTMTGVFGGSANQLVTDDGDGTVTSESGLTYDSEALAIGDDDDGTATIKRTPHSDDNGGALYIRGGDATAGQTDKDGGILRLYGGRGTSNGDGGAVSIFTSKATGSSGTVSHTSSAVATFRADGNTMIHGNLIFEGPTPDAHETTFSITDPTADRTITVPNEDVDLAEVNHHYDYLHLNCQMTAASTNQYMGYGGHYNFNIGATAYSDGGSVANKNTTKWSHYQAITAATIHTVYYNFTTTGGSGNDFVFELWEIVPGSGSANNTTNLIKQYSISGNASDSYLLTATDTTGYSLAAGAGLLPVIRKTGSAWAGNIFGEMTIKFKY